jgi:hypothetical protein
MYLKVMLSEESLTLMDRMTMCLNARPVVQDILYGQESSRKQKRAFGTEYGKEPFKQGWRTTPQIHI